MVPLRRVAYAMVPPLHCRAYVVVPLHRVAYTMVPPLHCVAHDLLVHHVVQADDPHLGAQTGVKGSVLLLLVHQGGLFALSSWLYTSECGRRYGGSIWHRLYAKL